MSESEQARPRSLPGATARLGASLLGLARSRLELASVEFAEERGRIQQQLTLLLAAITMFMFATLFVATWIIVYFWDTNRLTAIAVVAIVFAGVGAVLLMLRKEAATSAPTPFAATLAELDRDRVALAGSATREPAVPPKP
ncbi:MAG: phage holin family protein [Betaproteobacteria bacterium]